LEQRGGYWSRGRVIGAEGGLLEQRQGYWSRGRVIGAEGGGYWSVPQAENACRLNGSRDAQMHIQNLRMMPYAICMWSPLAP